MASQQDASARPRTSQRAEVPRDARVGAFVRAAIPDFALVWVLSIAMVMTAAFAFNSGAAFQGNVALVALLTFAPLVAAFAGSWSKRALVPSAIALVVVAIAYVIWGIATSSDAMADGLSVNDSGGNNLIFALIAFAVPVVEYLLSRRPVGLAVLAIADIAACGLVQYLYRDWLTSASGDVVAVVAFVAMLALFVFQGYRQSLYKAQRTSGSAFGAAWVFSLVISLLCVLVGCAVFYGAIIGAGLTTPEWKPFSDVRAKPEMQYTGIYDKQHVESSDLTTDELNDSQKDSNQDAEGGNSSGSAQGAGGGDSNMLSGLVELASGYDEDDPNMDITTVAYLLVNWWWAIVVALAVAALVAAVLLHRAARSRRLRKLESKPVAYRVWALYGFFVKRFGRLRAKKVDYLTPWEYAQASKRTLACFAEGTGGVDFVEVTCIYQRACLGGVAISDEEYGRVVAYYKAFFANARKRVGWFRWLFFKFWRM